LYHFDRNTQPRHFTERLGGHPEFPFLQELNGVNSTELYGLIYESNGWKIDAHRQPLMQGR